MGRVDRIAPDSVEDGTRLTDEARIVAVTDALLFGDGARVSKPEAVPGFTMLAEGWGEMSTGAEALNQRKRRGIEVWDLFICHASEDKDAVARPLAEALIEAGLEVWYDDFTLMLGDGLRRSIDRGIADSRFGVIILSPSFFQKEWPQRELDGLVSREIDGEKIV